MPARTFAAVIFDFDGVLIDSEPLYLSATNAVFAREGRVLTAEAAAEFSGLRYPEMLAQLIPMLGLSRDVAYYLSEARIFGAPLEPTDGAAALLHRLAHLNVPCAVGSSSDHHWVKSMLERLGLLDFVQVVVGGDQVQHGKPAPDVFLRCAELLGVQPTGCAVIEDSINGVLAARAAGMAAIGFPTFSRADLRAHECYALIESLTEAHDLLGLVLDASASNLADGAK